MKNVFKFLGIIAIIAVIGFSFVACGNGDNGDNTDSEATFSVSGKFNKAGGEEVKFRLSSTDNNARKAQAETAESYAISGELQDGDIVFLLSGTYDSVELNYTASASSSLIRYSINGAFDSDGNSLGSNATLLVRNSSTSDDWTAFYYEVDEAATVVITGTLTTEVVTGGIPAEVRGWYSASVKDMYMRLHFSQWSIEQQTILTSSDGRYVESVRTSVVEAENKDSYYDVIIGYLSTSDNDTIEKGKVGYMRYQMSFTSNSVTCSQYYTPQEDGEVLTSFRTVTEVKEVDDTSDPITFTR